MNSLGTDVDLQPEEIPNLRAGDEDGDPVGEADDDRARDEPHRRSHAGDAERDEQHAGHQRAHEQAIDAVARDDAGDDDDEGAGRARRSARAIRRAGR